VLQHCRICSVLRSRAAVLTVAVALGVLGACSGGDDDGGSAAGGPTTGSAGQTLPTQTSEQDPGAGSTGETQALSVTAVDFDFHLDSTDLPAGDYEISLTNDGDATHDLVVERDGADVAASDSTRPGDSTTLSVTLEPGTYVFYCSIGNHRQMGMEVEVTVS
jgi:plastocyanin